MPVRIEGGRELRRTLKKAGLDMKKLTAINREAANVVVPVAAARAPKSTGKLAASVRAGATQRAGVIRAGRKSVPYAGPLHWGWETRHIKPSWFITGAAKQQEPVWTELYMRHVRRVIKEVRGTNRV